MKIVLAILIAVSLAGCAAKAKMAEKRDPIFRLHDRNIIERDLTVPS